MSRTKTSMESNNQVEVKETAGYKRFRENVLEEEPNPYFCQEEEKGFFEEFKKDFPDATFHENTVIGTAVCKDKTARFVLGYEMLGASKAYAYLSGSLLLDTMEAETEGIALINGMLGEE